MGTFDQNKLRAFAGVILLLLALAYLILRSENTSIEYVMLSLAGFLVGGALLSSKNDQ